VRVACVGIARYLGHDFRNFFDELPLTRAIQDAWRSQHLNAHGSRRPGGRRMNGRRRHAMDVRTRIVGMGRSRFLDTFGAKQRMRQLLGEGWSGPCLPETGPQRRKRRSSAWAFSFGAEQAKQGLDQNHSPGAGANRPRTPAGKAAGVPGARYVRLSRPATCVN